MGKTLYEFKCTGAKCKYSTSEFVEYEKIDEFIEENKCPKCGESLKNAFGSSGIIFKGTDFTKRYRG